MTWLYCALIIGVPLAIGLRFDKWMSDRAHTRHRDAIDAAAMRERRLLNDAGTRIGGRG
jgi:D-alanyl-D-alanine dipeptidase